MSKKADRQPLIEHEAPVSHIQSSDIGPAVVRKQAATPADSEAGGSLAVAAAADEDGEEDGVLDFFLWIFYLYVALGLAMISLIAPAWGQECARWSVESHFQQHEELAACTDSAAKCNLAPVSTRTIASLACCRVKFACVIRA